MRNHKNRQPYSRDQAPAATAELFWHSQAPIGIPLGLNSKKHYDKVGPEEANFQSVGTGPWEMVEVKAGEFRRVQAVRDHWRKTPEWDEMIWRMIPEESTRLANFLTGTLDTGTFSMESIIAIQAKDNPEFKYITYPGLFLWRVDMFGGLYQLDHPLHAGVGGEPPKSPKKVKMHPLGGPEFCENHVYVSCNRDITSDEWIKKQKVREALAIAIDRQRLVTNLSYGNGRDYNMFLWSVNEPQLKKLNLDNVFYEYDPERAKQLLTEAGYPNGITVPKIIAPDRPPGAPEVATAVATMWAEVGIKTTVSKESYSAHAELRRSGEADSFMTYQNTPSYPEPLRFYNFYTPRMSSVMIEHPIMTDLIDKANVTLDTDKRWELEGQNRQVYT